MNQSAAEPDPEIQRRGGRRQQQIPVPQDRRKDERRRVPGFSVLFEELALELELDETGDARESTEPGRA